eukprot:gene10010-11068_t
MIITVALSSLKRVSCLSPQHLWKSSIRSQHGVVVKAYSDSYEIRSLDLHDHGHQRKVFYVDEGRSEEDESPILLLGGTAQTVNSFTLHISQIARHRRLIIPELRGQGKTELSSEFATMGQHVQDVCDIIKALGLRKVHLAGFSFGGRVALAVAAHHPDLVDKLSLTGICYSRPPLGQMILKSWEEAAGRGNMRECAWSFILNGYSQSYIERYSSRIPSFIDMVVEANQASRLHDLIRLSHRADSFSVEACAPNVIASTQIIAATEDRIAGYEACLDLAQHVPCQDVVTLQAGHLAPFEQPVQWRKALLDFISKTP